MDFFEQQDRARRNTILLTVFFVIAVVLIILAVYAAFTAIYLGSMQPPKGAARLPRFWNPDLFIWTTAGTLLIIITGTFYKIRSLSGGGDAVARIFGAAPVNPQTADPAERRLLNVVEEIAIAAGMPVPRVYVLDEECINAFAAGFTTGDAVIGVTRGCMTMLSRDELQGVIAHEFSHILNGDMRLNLRLMGVLHGILVISLIGWWIFRITTQSSRSGLSGAARKKGPAAFIILGGLALMVIGYIGVFFARLIKSAVSRQREFLADAASVQFTRNPGGISGALKKIGGLAQGGQLMNPKAEEASHLFFADGMKHAFFNLMSTHPPLAERIRRIEPSFNGTFPVTARPEKLFIDEEQSPAVAAMASPANYRQAATAPIPLDPEHALQTVGKLDAQSLENVSRWLASIPDPVRRAVREPETAQAIVIAMLVSRDGAMRARQLELLKHNSGQPLFNNVVQSLPAMDQMPQEWRMPLSDLAMASLRRMRKSDLKVFAGQLKLLAESDGDISLFEFMIQSMIAGRIQGWSRRFKGYFLFQSNFNRHFPAMETVLSTLAYYGGADEAGAAQAYAEGLKRLPLKESRPLLPKDKCGLSQVAGALPSLNAAGPKTKRCFLDACVTCVVRDGHVSISEAELLRAVAAALDCPVPPVMPTT